PLQEARRQRRQRCGEGVVALDLVPEGPADVVDPHHVLTNYPQGQVLVAGWGTIAPAVELRRLAAERGLYLETFLAAAYPVGAGARSLPDADRFLLRGLDREHLVQAGQLDQFHQLGPDRAEDQLGVLQRVELLVHGEDDADRLAGEVLDALEVDDDLPLVLLV